MKAIKNLKSLTISYDLLMGKGITLPNTVSLRFCDQLGAAEFTELFVTPSGERTPASKHIGFSLIPGIEGNTQIQLHLASSHINAGMRVNAILDFIRTGFVLPKTLTINCRNPNKAFDLINLNLSSDNLNWLGFEEKVFLEKIALRDLVLQDNLSALISSPVVVQLLQNKSNSTYLELTCVNEHELKRLKMHLYEIALKDNVDHLFHFKQVHGVAGVTHNNKCFIKINTQLDFHNLIGRYGEIKLPMSKQSVRLEHAITGL